MTSKQALEKIKNIELSHIEYYDDDDYIDDYFNSYEESDGTIEENYSDEIKTIERDLEVLEIFKNNRIDIDQLALFLSIECDDKSSYEVYKEVTPYANITFEKFVLLKEWWLKEERN